MSFAFVHLALYFLRRNLYASVVDSSNVNAILDSYLKLLLILAFSVSADPDRGIELSQFFFKFYFQNSADTTIMHTMQRTHIPRWTACCSSPRGRCCCCCSRRWIGRCPRRDSAVRSARQLGSTPGSTGCFRSRSFADQADDKRSTGSIGSFSRSSSARRPSATRCCTWGRTPPSTSG